MSDEFANLIERANAFHAELRANNTRDWFEPRKDTYRDQIKKPAELLCDVIADELRRMTGTTFKPKLFRIHRDVRFSKDKTPYNTYLHIMWRQASEAAPAWFFGASPDYLRVMVGMPGLKGEALDRLRAFIDREGAALKAAMEAAPEGDIPDFGVEPLKRVPKPYPPDHPHGDLIRRKGLVYATSLAGDWRVQGLVPAFRQTAQGLLPIWSCLDQGMATVPASLSV